jgi:hypothetical protein
MLEELMQKLLAKRDLIIKEAALLQITNLRILPSMDGIHPQRLSFYADAPEVDGDNMVTLSNGYSSAVGDTSALKLFVCEQTGCNSTSLIIYTADHLAEYNKVFTSPSIPGRAFRAEQWNKTAAKLQAALETAPSFFTSNPETLYSYVAQHYPTAVQAGNTDWVRKTGEMSLNGRAPGGHL